MYFNQYIDNKYFYKVCNRLSIRLEWSSKGRGECQIKIYSINIFIKRRWELLFIII